MALFPRICFVFVCDGLVWGVLFPSLLGFWCLSFVQFLSLRDFGSHSMASRLLLGVFPRASSFLFFMLLSLLFLFVVFRGCSTSGEQELSWLPVSSPTPGIN
jgi:hypothetical protein